MIKRIVLFLILPSLLFGQISNWKDKTINQLSGIVSGTTNIGSKSYWETRAYNQIHDIINRIDKIQYASDYGTITDAFSGVADSSGGELFIPKGTYSITQSGDIDGMLEAVNNMVIRGEGFGSIIDFTKDVVNGNVIIDINGDTNVVITSLRINGDITAAYLSEFDHCINIRDAAYVIIENCYIYAGGGDGIYIRDSDHVLIRNCVIIGDSLDSSNSNSRNGISLIDCDDVKIENCYIYGFTVAGIDIEPNSGEVVTNVSIMGNRIDNSYGYGIAASCGNTEQIRNVSIIGNNISNTNYCGLLLWAVDGGYLSDVTVSGNTFYNCLEYKASNPAAVEMTLHGYGGERIVFDGNVLYDDYTDGAIARGLFVTGDTASSVIISNNVFHNFRNAQEVIQVRGSAANYLYGVNISDNVIRNFGRSTSAFDYGINILYLGHSIISGNSITDTTTYGNYGIYYQYLDSVLVCNNTAICSTSVFRAGTGNNSAFFNNNFGTGYTYPTLDHGRFFNSKTYYKFHSNTDTYGLVFSGGNIDTVAYITGAGYMKLFGQGSGAAGRVLMYLNADTSNGQTQTEIYTNVPKIVFYQQSTGYPILNFGELDLNGSNATTTDIDTVCTVTGLPRWLKITTGGETFWSPVDTSIVK